MYVVISVYVNDDTASVEDAGAIGPFSTESDAYRWGESNWGNDTDWFVSIISSPDVPGWKVV